MMFFAEWDDRYPLCAVPWQPLAQSSNGAKAMNTKLASAFGLAMLAVAFSFSSSFACPETSHTSASVVESAVSEGGVNITPLAEASAPEAQVGEIVPAPSVISTIDAPPTEASAPPAIVSADAVLVEITETVTVVVPGQKSEDDEGATIAASGIAAIEPTVTEESSQAAAPESEAKATELPEPTGIAEAQIEVAPAAVEPLSTDALPAIVSVEAVPVEITETVTVVVPGQAKATELSEPTDIAEVAPAAVEPPSTDVNALPAIVSVEAVPVEITETVTVVVPGQKLQDIDDVEITGSKPEHPPAAPNLKHDEAPAALDDEE